MTETLMSKAITLAERGYYVLPIMVWQNPNGEHEKMPLIKWGTQASNDPETIRSMRQSDESPAWDDATHVGVACEPSGLVVVDIDPYNNDEEDHRVEGEELFSEWQTLVGQHHDQDQLVPEEFDPPWVTTISNGVHAFFRSDPSKPMTNSAKDITHCIDIRGIGGMIVIYHPDVMPLVSELPVMPGWLHELALSMRSQRESTTPVAPPESPRYVDGEAGTSYGLSALQVELDKLTQAWDNWGLEGKQFNENLNEYAFAVGQLAGGGELDPAEAHDALREKLIELGAPASQFKTLDSGFNSGYDRPRSRKQVILEESEITDEQINAFMAKCLDSRGLDQLPPPRWLVPGWLELNSTAQLVGPSRSGKSFIALDIAARLSRGMSWPTTSSESPDPVRVAYIVAESVGGFAERKRAWEAQHGQVGELLFYPDSIQIMANEWRVAVEALKRWGPQLIIVDTQARCTVGVDENHAKDMGMVVQRIDALKEATGACILLVHHTAKTNESARGSNVVLGSLETEIFVTKTRDNRIKVDNTKQKNDREAGKIFFELCDAGPSVVPMPMSPELTAQAQEGIHRSNIKMQVRQYLQEQHSPKDTNEIFEGVDAKSRPRVVTALGDLVQSGEVIKTTEYRRSRNCSVYLWNPPA